MPAALPPSQSPRRGDSKTTPGDPCPDPDHWAAVGDVLIVEVGEYHAAITRSVIPAMRFSNICVKVVDQLAPTNGKLGDGLHPDEAGSAAMATFAG